MLKLESIFPTLELDFTLPALLPFSRGRGILFTASGKAKTQAIQAVQSIILRLLSTIPPGKLKFLFIDPVGLGQNMAPFMSLADYEEALITNRAWSEPRHIEQRLADIAEHMETVIQKYLRSDYATIEEYNEKAGEIAEPYQMVVVMDFPVNFSETAARRLQSIAQNGPRCGVYTFVVADKEKNLPYGFKWEELTGICEVITWNGNRFIWDNPDFSSCFLELDQLPPDGLVKHIVETVGKQAKENMKVEVPFEKLLRLAQQEAGTPENVFWWGVKADTELKIPLGPAGARKLRHLEFGKGTAHHALVIGRPGSGKSNLMHIIITAAALFYPPEEIQFYLVDFKKGVEFISYTDPPLPHARVIAVESEREFGLSVLQGLDEELQRRGILYRDSGSNSFGQYRQKIKGQEEKLPRIILLVDEFQEFFVMEDNISRTAGLILDRLVRQGRAFGMHVLLGSQTLAGSYSLPRSTMDQMAVRIALQCSDADSRLILADDNPAARLLSRPGEAIYNTHSGLVEGNQPFQVALFNDRDSEHYLEEVARLAKNSARNHPLPIIFKGHEPSHLDKCIPLNELLALKGWPAEQKTTTAFLGEPIAIRPPIAACFRPQSGSHLLVVTREEAEGLGMLVSSWLSLAVQHSPEKVMFYFLDFSSADAPWADLPEDLASMLPHQVEVLGRRDLPGLFRQLVELIRQRMEEEHPGKRVYLFIQGLHRIRDLRQEEQGYRFAEPGEEKLLSLPEQFMFLLREGPEVGVHVLCWCDTYGNLMRVMDKRSLAEFTMRVAGAMSGDDSLSLLDDPMASRLDKPHRLIFFDEDRPGYLEKFRPYALPENIWLREFLTNLNAKQLS